MADAKLTLCRYISSVFLNLSTSGEAFWRTQYLLFCSIINVDVSTKTFKICCGGRNEF